MPKMEEQRNSEFQFQNQESFISRLSSNRSIDKRSGRSSSHSLTSKHSILDVLDIEEKKRKISSGPLSQLDQDSYSRILRYSGSSSKDLQPNLSLSENYKMFDEIPNFTNEANSYNRHQCVCPKQGCSEDGCPCSLAINQLCVIGLCCNDCIAKKNISMSGQNATISQSNKQKKAKLNKIRRQNNHIKSIKKANKAKVHKDKYDFVYCTCKKTQCMKKYCPCYALNKQCNECCICQQCQNCSDEQSSNDEKKRKHERHNHSGQDENGQKIKYEGQDHMKEQISNGQQDIDNYFQQSPDNYSNVELNKVMDFEPVDFGYYKR